MPTAPAGTASALRRLETTLSTGSGPRIAERLARAYVGTENGPFLIYRRRRFANWLSDQLHNNLPYDRLVRELIDSTGIWTSAPAVIWASVPGSIKALPSPN